MKRKKRNIVNVSLKVHNQLTKINKPIFPKVFLLGKNNNDVICKAIELEKYRACENMPGISSKSLTENSLKLYKQNLIPYGIARIGNSFFDQKKRFGGATQGGRGFDLGIILTYNSYCDPCGTELNNKKQRKITYAVV